MHKVIADKRGAAMGRVHFGMTMSLDGFVADRDAGVRALYPDFEQMRQSETLRELVGATGAVVMGRRSNEMAGGDWTDYEFQVPIFVLDARPADEARLGAGVHVRQRRRRERDQAS